VAAAFWDRKGVLVKDLMKQGIKMASKVYCEALKNCVWPFRTKEHGMLTSGVVLLDDNARPHTAARPRVLL
jgi:hypothetical protein